MQRAGAERFDLPSCHGWNPACSYPTVTGVLDACLWYTISLSEGVSAMSNMPSSCVWIFFEENIFSIASLLIANTNCNDDKYFIISISCLG